MKHLETAAKKRLEKADDANSFTSGLKLSAGQLKLAEPKMMSVKEFRELGFLQEVNRLFLHPLGMALEVTIKDDGEEKLGGILDCRDDPEGIIFHNLDESGLKKIELVHAFSEEKHKERLERLGYIIQPPY